MAKRKKRIATVNRKLGISISCRVQKPVLKDLDAYRKPLFGVSFLTNVPGSLSQVDV